jgi:hypothetical protein
VTVAGWAQIILFAVVVLALARPVGGFMTRVFADEDHWPPNVGTQRLHAAYLGHATDHRERRPVDDWEMVQRLEPLWKACGVRKKRLAADPVTGSRPRVYVLAALGQHRAAFSDAMGIGPEEVGWADDGEDADG